VDGIFLAPTTPSIFSVADSFVGDIVATGIDIRPPSSASINGVIHGVTVRDAITGIALKGFASTATVNLNVQVVNSVVGNNSGYGFYAASSINHPYAFLYLRNVSTSNDGIGVYASGGEGWIFLSHSIISEYTSAAWKTDNNGQIYTYGDNVINGAVSGSLSPLPMQ
jgi:hypothetical protein